MIDLKIIRETPEVLKQALEKRNAPNPWKDDPSGLNWESFLALNKDYKEILQTVEKLRTRRNQIAEEFGKLKKQGQDTSALSKEIETLKTDLTQKETEHSELEKKITQALLRIPNFLHASVPDGKSSEDNVQVRQCGR